MLAVTDPGDSSAMSPSSPPTDAAPPRRRSLQALRVLMMAMAVLVLYQATMAGLVLDGNPDGLLLHEIGSHTATLLGPVTAVTAIIAWRRGHVGPGVAVSALALPVLVQVQAQAGYARESWTCMCPWCRPARPRAPPPVGRDGAPAAGVEGRRSTVERPRWGSA